MMDPEAGDLYGIKVIVINRNLLNNLPQKPTCPSLLTLNIHAAHLLLIAPTFFESMPLLKDLDLSNSNIMSLTPSISRLTSLERFFLRNCTGLNELPTDIGALTTLKLFDIQGTNLMYLPKELGKLKGLVVLRVSLSEHAVYYVKNECDTVVENVIPRKMLSELKKLKELSIIVPPEAEWWEEEVIDIQNELCDMENLETLRWHLPTGEALQQFLLLERNQLPLYATLSSFMLAIGQRAPHAISRLPDGLEEKFEKFKNCLKWINSIGSVDDVSKIMASVEALFLAQNSTMEKLSTFNVSKLKYCLLAGCNEMETLVEAPEDVKYGENVGLELLEYLSIHYMNKLQTIWKGPIGKDSLSKLKVLALHSCPNLTSIFTLSIAQNLPCLIELTVERCRKVRSLISTDQSHTVECGQFFPRLERINLVSLTELDKIFDCPIILEKLDTLLIYACFKLRSLDFNELPHIRRIIGRYEWWKDLNHCNCRREDIFMPLTKENDYWVKELFDATDSLKHFHDIAGHAPHDEIEIEQDIGVFDGGVGSYSGPHDEIEIEQDIGVFDGVGSCSGSHDEIEIEQDVGVRAGSYVIRKRHPPRASIY